MNICITQKDLKKLLIVAAVIVVYTLAVVLITTMLTDIKAVAATNEELSAVEETVVEEPKPTPVVEVIPPRYNDIGITPAERELLASIVWLEARGECFSGQQAVVEVILNRVHDENFPDSVAGVIYQSGQFESAAMVHTADPGEVQYMAIDQALSGPNVLPEGVVFFSAQAQNSKVWGNIGGHTFCYSRYWNGEA
ncbi:MAG: cell wall hydrolase [Oscillospiraceae bacterium]|nr:cell wall hydrolase [Oscillospiraceae bacterium]MBR4078320.1 cell wall hydrolase [Oscillospiraceae bacterium]